MRTFLILLAIAAPVVLASPHFWSLWRMETSRERVVYVLQNGVSQTAWIGPASPWPSWAAAPGRAKLRVQAHFEPAPGEPTSGYADVETAGPAMAVIADYERRLSEAGWKVETHRLDLTSPDLPPQPLRYCVVRATHGSRGLMLQIDREGADRPGRLFWSEPPHPAPIGAGGPC
jgi:hypothetical protein